MEFNAFQMMNQTHGYECHLLTYMDSKIKMTQTQLICNKENNKKYTIKAKTESTNTKSELKCQSTQK